MSRYAKALVGAVVGALIAGLSSLATALADPAASFGTLTDGQWVSVALAFLGGLGITGGAVYAIPNRPPAGEPRQPDLSEQAP